MLLYLEVHYTIQQGETAPSFQMPLPNNLIQPCKQVISLLKYIPNLIPLEQAYPNDPSSKLFRYPQMGRAIRQRRNQAIEEDK